MGMDLFIDDEGGYTTVAVALALLVSLALVFGAASAQWVMSRSADVQAVADASALAGENVVAGFVTIAQVLDACVLSLGIAGVLTYGVGLVVCAIPGAQEVGKAVIEVGKKVLEARQSFAQTASDGLQRLEATLPALIVINSGSCVSANATVSGLPYAGCAIPFPQESESEYSSIDDLVDTEELDDAASDLQEASAKAQAAKERADAALLEGWFADCGDVPYCLCERAGSLAGLSGASNPSYPTTAGWNFGVPLSRARAYYAARLAAEAPRGTGVDAMRDSFCRLAFYNFALDAVNDGYYTEHEDGSVDIYLPRLPHNSNEVRGCSLYTEAIWPCSQEEAGRTLHAYATCPGATGASSGFASLATLESGGVRECPVCHMGVGDMGKVASASTNINNGFEHHWRRIVDASEDYEKAADDLAEAQSEMKDIAEDASLAYERALAQLAVPRPKLCPPGAWGCVSVVLRSGGTAVPSELTSGFLSEASLPTGAAVSAATLAPDDATAENNVLSRLLDGFATPADPSAAGGFAGPILDAWGRLLVGYGSGYERVSDVAGSLFDGIEGVFGESVASWLRQKLEHLVEVAGFEPADMRLRKPVLVGSAEVLDKAGFDDVSTVRNLVQSLPADAGPIQMAAALGLYLADEVGAGEFTIAELPIPGTDIKIPLTIDLRALAGLA